MPATAGCLEVHLMVDHDDRPLVGLLIGLTSPRNAHLGTVALLIHYATLRALHGLNDLTTEFGLKLSPLLRRKKLKFSVAYTKRNYKYKGVKCQNSLGIINPVVLRFF